MTPDLVAGYLMLGGMQVRLRQTAEKVRGPQPDTLLRAELQIQDQPPPVHPQTLVRAAPDTELGQPTIQAMLRTLRHLPFLLPALAIAQPGTLDPTFSGDGLFTQEVSAYDDVVNAVLVQPDGKTVGAGTIDDGSFVYSFVQRLTLAGTPDPSFGMGGVALLAVAGQQPYAYAVGMQSDGSILIAGLIYDMNMDGNAFVMRVLSSGALDTGFGTDGIASLNFGTEFGFQSAWAMRVMDDDRIVLVGEDGENGVACARLTPDGAMDPSFGNGGLALTGIPFGSGLSVHLYADGSVLAGGYRIDGGSDLLLARFDVNGVLDPPSAPRA